MYDELIRQIAKLMREQAASYRRLDMATGQLSAVLVRGTPDVIESLTKAGESELLKMRSRLLQITAALNNFAEARANNPEKTPLGAEARTDFEEAAKELLDTARSFQKTSSKASNLALGGSSFSTACLQFSGVPPTTYRAPVLSRGLEAYK